MMRTARPFPVGLALLMGDDPGAVVGVGKMGEAVTANIILSAQLDSFDLRLTMKQMLTFCQLRPL